MNFEEYANSYFDEATSILDSINVDDLRAIVDLLWETYTNDKSVYIFGNGGSAAIATHFASDLNSTTIGHKKDFAGKRFKAVSLAANVSELTAWANDIGYENIFKGPLENFLKEGDLVIGISSSGNSTNVIEAAKFAKSKGAKVIGLTGMGGGKLKDSVDAVLVVDSDHYGQVEGTHSVLTHLITFYLAEKMRTKSM